MTESRWMTTEEAAKYARVHIDTMRGWARNGTIKAGSDGRHYKFTKEMIDAHLMGVSR